MLISIFDRISRPANEETDHLMVSKRPMDTQTTAAAYKYVESCFAYNLQLRI